MTIASAGSSATCVCDVHGQRQVSEEHGEGHGCLRRTWAGPSRGEPRRLATGSSPIFKYSHDS